MESRRLTRRGFLRRSAVLGTGMVLAACGASSAPSRSGKATSGSGQPQSAQQATGSVVFWNESTGQDLTDFCTSARYFQKSKSGADIKVTCQGYSGFDKVLTTVSAGNPPDLVQSWDRSSVLGMYDKGGLTPLTKYIKSDRFDTSMVLPGALDGCKAYDGTQVALPYMCYGSTDFFWNKKLFREKGLDPEQPPQTLEELKEIGEKFDEYQNGKLVRIGFHPTYACGPEVWVLAFGGSIWDPKTRELTVDDPGVVKGLKWLQGYADKYGANNLAKLAASFGQQESANNPFLAGTVAMTCYWDAMVAYRDRYAPQVEMGFTTFPHPASMPQQKGFGEISFNPVFIPKGAKHPDQAWQLLRFIEEDINSNVSVATALSNTPQNVKAIRSPRNHAPAMLKDIQRYVAGSKMRAFPPSIPAMSEFADKWSSETSLMFDGKVSVQAGLEKIKSAIQPEINNALKS